ncbi:hypothetical protein [Pedobacter sp. Leaf176]|uniref:hypothetical protein n=1 Tax=Pedobacter sp. Leaf176 TaxID=1736286 RepID=UPI0006F2A028|nr:hypothetical protein [Pedobacter sp. Leaf176]KQR65218.1 hypothetical protein ASF92_19985 [Pedobacter sp. Leaf176]
MKTSIYNKDEHLEGYVGSDKESKDKSDVQKEYEKGNEGNEVHTYGKEPDLTIEGNSNAKDGFDNSGTQGKDSLSDDTYNSPDKDPTIESAESHTGSSSKDFETKPLTDMNQRDEDDVLNTGI